MGNRSVPLPNGTAALRCHNLYTNDLGHILRLKASQETTRADGFETRPYIAPATRRARRASSRQALG